MHESMMALPSWAGGRGGSQEMAAGGVEHRAMPPPRIAVGVWSAIIAVGLGLAAFEVRWHPSGVLSAVASRRVRVAAAVLAGVAALALPFTSHDAARRAMPRVERALATEAAPPAPATPAARAATCAAPPSPEVPTAFVTSPSGISCLQ